MLDEIPFDFNDEVNRRIDQFGNWIRTMSGRRRRVEDTNCFLIFDEDDPKGNANVKKLSRAKSLVYTESASLNGWCGGCDETSQDDAVDNSRDNGRFVQFCFEDDFFWMDLPNVTLSKVEAERIMRDRNGFFWIKDNPNYATRYDKQFDQLTKFYLYGDEQRAAEDMAHIFFEQWKFPTNCRLYVKAACFDGADFEWGWPIQ